MKHYDKTPGTGQEGYIISKDWITNYMIYIGADDLYEDPDSDDDDEIGEDHWIINHPGPIYNEDILEKDKCKKNLYGS